MEFIGTIQHFDKGRMLKDSFEYLEHVDDSLTQAVELKSPKNQLILEAKFEGRLDVRWEPFLHHLESIAKTKSTYWRKVIIHSIVSQLRKSDVLGNYVLTLLILSYSEGEDRHPNIKLFHERIDPLFQAVKLLDLHTRTPMAFNDNEQFAIKVITQTARLKKESEEFCARPEPILYNFGGEGLSPRVIQPPVFVKKSFGGKDAYNLLSLKTYGDRFLQIFHEKDFSLY